MPITEILVKNAVDYRDEVAKKNRALPGKTRR